MGNKIQKLNEKTAALMDERFGRDKVIALATACGDMPYVRGVNAYYMDGAFYAITHAKSNKIAQLALNPNCAVSGEWFSAQGVGESMGWFGLRRTRTLPTDCARYSPNGLTTGTMIWTAPTGSYSK